MVEQEQEISNYKQISAENKEKVSQLTLENNNLIKELDKEREDRVGCVENF